MQYKMLVSLTVLVFAIGACATNTAEPTKVGEAGEPTGTAEASQDAAPKVFAVGDVIEAGKFQLIVHSVKNPLPPNSEFLEPKAGNRFVGIDLEVKNTSNEEQNFSILLGAEVQDAKNQSYRLALTDHEPAAPDGGIPAGSGKRGLLVVEIPDSEAAAGLKLLFKSDLLGKTAVVQLN